MTLVTTRRGVLGGALLWPLARPLAALAAGSGSDAGGARVPPGYGLVFADEFDDANVARLNEDATGGRPGAPAWRTRFRQPRKDVTNQEKQIYMDVAFAGTGDRPLGVQPFRMGEGALHIVADRADAARVKPLIWNYGYTSGCISSERTHAQRYGYFEVRARLPKGRGFWPAFWLLPRSGGWPPEIDILEASGARPRSLWSNVHSNAKTDAAGGDPPVAPPSGRWVDGEVDTTADFHVYGMEWTPDRIVCSFDGVPFSDTRGHGIHEEMYLVANLAVGSHDAGWIPDPDASTPFPSTLSIDYIRCYARA